MSGCTHRYAGLDGERECPHPTAADHDRCVFHLTPAEREAAGVTDPELRAAVRADLDAEDPTRREYVDIELRELDLSALVVDGDDAGHLTFRSVTVEGAVDLSGAIVRHPIAFEECEIGRLTADRAAFEMEVTIRGCRFGGDAAEPTPLRVSRGSFDRSLRVSDTEIDGNTEFAGCRVAGWLGFDEVTVTGAGHFPNATVGTAQFVSTAFEAGVEFDGADVDTAVFDGVGVGDDALDLSGMTAGELRVQPASNLHVRLVDAAVSAGELGQPDVGVATYDFTDAAVGDIDLNCDADSFDRYRFYRTRFEGFPFASYHTMLRANRWRVHEYVGTPETDPTVEGLEQTYLEAKRGAADVGDSETGSMFFVRELRYRRQRYAAHARATTYSASHRINAALRWLTNGFLDIIAGYGERPQRTAVLSLTVILGCAAVYPATEGLATGSQVLTYAANGPSAAFDSLYFSMVTFATLGLGDVRPVGTVGRFIAASQGLVGAFLTAVFVFSLGRRVTR